VEFLLGCWVPQLIQKEVGKIMLEEFEVSTSFNKETSKYTHLLHPLLKANRSRTNLFLGSTNENTCHQRTLNVN
jgi:hypothetical protein